MKSTPRIIPDGSVTGPKLATDLLVDGNTPSMVDGGFQDVVDGTRSLNYAAATDYNIVMCNSLNNHMQQEGVMVGATVRIFDATPIAGLGFAVLRPNGMSGADPTYTIVGISEEFTSLTSSVVNTMYFDEPITGLRCDDIIAVIVKQSADGNMFRLWYAAGDSTSQLVINDGARVVPHTSTTPTNYREDNAEVAYSSFGVGDDYTLTTSTTDYRVLMARPIMLSPKVAIVGDSIAWGVYNTTPYHINLTVNDRIGAYIQVACQNLGWSYINCSGSTASNNLEQVLSGDIPLADEFNPQIIWCRSMRNDINDGFSWTRYKTAFLALLADCQSKGRILIMDGEVPFSRSGEEARSATIASYDSQLRALCKEYHVPNCSYLDFMAYDDGSFATQWKNLDWTSDTSHMTLAGKQVAGTIASEYYKSRIIG